MRGTKYTGTERWGLIHSVQRTWYCISWHHHKSIFA